MFEFLGCIVLFSLAWSLIAVWPWFFLLIAFFCVCGAIKTAHHNYDDVTAALGVIGILIAIMSGITLIFDIDPMTILKMVL